MYEPAIFTSTVPETTMLFVMSPSKLSAAVAPGSLKEPPNSSDMLESPINDNIGAVVSSTVTVLVTSTAEFPELSVTLYLIVVTPIDEVSTVPVETIAFVIFPS